MLGEKVLTVNWYLVDLFVWSHYSSVLHKAIAQKSEPHLCSAKIKRDDCKESVSVGN